MKTSRLILVFVLSGLVGNVFAAPVKLYCQWNGGASGFEVIFDELDKLKMIVAGQKIPRVETQGSLIYRYKVYTMSDYLIEWGSETESTRTSFNASTNITINRSTGKMVFYRESSESGSDKKEGECMKADNVIKKF